MLAPEDFHFVEILTRAELARHPVWHHYEDERDRPKILGWGVDEDLLDREVARFAGCGPEPLYPVLQLDPLPEAEHLNIAVTFETASGAAFSGYLIEPHAFGVFAGDRELCLNKSLPALAERQVRKLAEASGLAAGAIFPLRYSAPGLRRGDGSPVEGEIARFW